MNSPTRWIGYGIPTVMGLGIAFLGISFLRSEERLEARRLELEIQLGSKTLSKKI